MIESKFSLIDIQSFLLIGGSLLKLKESLSTTSQLAPDISIPFNIFVSSYLQRENEVYSKRNAGSSMFKSLRFSSLCRPYSILYIILYTFAYIGFCILPWVKPITQAYYDNRWGCTTKLVCFFLRHLCNHYGEFVSPFLYRWMWNHYHLWTCSKVRRRSNGVIAFYSLFWFHYLVILFDMIRIQKLERNALQFLYRK